VSQTQPPPASPPAQDHICTTCHCVCAPAGALGSLLGSATIGLAILAALATRDGNVALAATPMSIGGLAAVLRSRPHCPRCGSHAIVPLSTPRGRALVPEALREAEGGT
jgi:hypothetical protein